jgi:hypothetical protein
MSEHMDRKDYSKKKGGQKILKRGMKKNMRELLAEVVMVEISRFLMMVGTLFLGLMGVN